VFEVEQKMTDPKLTKCPKCGGKVRRLISKGVSLQFKGEGFYCTDYKDKE
jgi:putative FmdB family regulatory protein